MRVSCGSKCLFLYELFCHGDLKLDLIYIVCNVICNISLQYSSFTILQYVVLF